MSKASLVIVTICVPSRTTKVLPAHDKAATIKMVRYGQMPPSSLTNLVRGTLQASLQAMPNKRVLPSPLHLPPSPHGMASKRVTAMGVLLSTSVPMVASLLAW